MGLFIFLFFVEIHWPCVNLCAVRDVIEKTNWNYWIPFSEEQRGKKQRIYAQNNERRDDVIIIHIFENWAVNEIFFVSHFIDPKTWHTKKIGKFSSSCMGTHNSGQKETTAK